MSRRIARWRRRLAVGGLCTGLASAAVGGAGLAGAWADTTAGSNFGAIAIAATAYGIRAPLYSHNGEDAEADVPYATATLGTGGLAKAITSVFWPGSTGASGGDSLKLLAGSCLPPNPANYLPLPAQVGGTLPNPPCLATLPTLPDSVYSALDDPYVAEAQSGTGQPTVSQSAPGIVTMTATATAPLVSAETDLLGGMLPATVGSFGATTTSTVIKLTGPNTAVVDAVSTVRDLSLGGGAVTLSALRSVAHAVTNGTSAQGTTTTTITGMKVNGVPVTLDANGLHIDGQGTAFPSLAALNSALAPTGVKLYLVAPTRTISGPAATLFSGDLVFALNNSQYTSNANDTGVVLSVGGAAISATSHLGYPFQFMTLPLGGTGGSGVATGGTGALGASVPGSGSLATPTGGGPAPAVTGTAAGGGSTPRIAPAAFALPGGLDGLWVALVLLGAGVLALGLGMLPRHLLATTGPACPLEGSS